MSRERGRLLRLRNSIVDRGEHGRSSKDASENRRARLFHAGQGLACALVLLFIFRALGQVLVFGAAGAALVLLLQQLVDPTPLFWSAPWEALQLVLSRRQRLNHAWLHRAQDLALESIGRSTETDGFAMADGFVLTGVGLNKQLVQRTVDSAWRGMTQTWERTSDRRTCKAVRFLVAVWLMIGGLLAISIWRAIDLPGCLMIALLSAAAGHALARPVENVFRECVANPAWLARDSRGFRFELEPIEFPDWLWWQGCRGFIVQRVSVEEPGKD